MPSKARPRCAPSNVMSTAAARASPKRASATAQKNSLHPDTVKLLRATGSNGITTRDAGHVRVGPVDLVGGLQRAKRPGQDEVRTRRGDLDFNRICGLVNGGQFKRGEGAAKDHGLVNRAVEPSQGRVSAA